jgi:membrane-associated protein
VHLASEAAHLLALNPLDPKSLINTFGLIGIFVILIAETGLLIGFFLPGDTLLLAAGAFAATSSTSGIHLQLAPLLIGAPIAAIIGAQAGHYIGVKGGSRLFAREDARLFRREYVVKTEKVFNRFGGGKAVVLARFIPIVRTFINPVAGILEMPARRFFVWNVIGGVVWTIGIIMIGYGVGHSFPIDKYVLPVVAVVVLLSFASIGMEMLRTRRLDRAANSSTTD